jgi:VIT1/CCC1 family predicted Fe2+/Mn2+ transporter
MDLKSSRGALYLRTMIFGVTDSLVSTVGLLAGIHVAGASRSLVVITGVVYAIVEAFSMAVGDFLSEESAEEYAARGDVSDKKPISAAVLMFFTFVLVALIPVAPYLFLGDPHALAVSVLLSLAALFAAGAVGAWFAKVPMLWRGVRMMGLGGAAILIGLVVGSLFPAA